MQQDISSDSETGSAKYLFSEQHVPAVFFIIAWFLIVVIPLFFFQKAFVISVEISEKSLKNKLEEQFFEEMENFQSDLNLRTQIQNAIIEAANENGIIIDNPKQKYTLPPNNVDPQIFSKPILNKFLISIRKRLGVLPLTVFMIGCDLKETIVFAHPEYFTNTNKPSKIAVEMMMRSIAEVSDKQSLVYHSFFSSLKKTLLNKDREDYLKKAKGFYQSLFGKFFQPPFFQNIVSEFYTPRFGDGRLFAFVHFAQTTCTKNPKLLGGMMITFHSRMFSLNKLMHNALNNTGAFAAKRGFFIGRYKEPTNFTGIIKKNNWLYFIKPVPQEISYLQYKEGKTFLDLLYKKNFSPKVAIIPFMGVGFHKSAFHHPNRAILPTMNSIIAILIIFSGLTIGLFIRSNVIPGNKIRIQVVILLTVTIFVPLVGLCITVFSYLEMQGNFEKRDILNRQHQELRNFETGVSTFESFMLGNAWQMRKEITEVIASSPQELEKLLQKWEKSKIFSGFYFLRRDGFEFISEGLMPNRLTSHPTIFSKDTSDLTKALAAIFLISSQMSYNGEQEWTKPLEDFVKAKVTEGTWTPFIKSLVSTFKKQENCMRAMNIFVCENGGFVKNPLMDKADHKMSSMLISKGNDPNNYGLGCLILLFPYEKLAEEYFSKLMLDGKNFRKKIGNFRIRHSIYKFHKQKKFILPKQVFSYADTDLLKLANKALEIGKDISLDQTQTKHPRLIASRIFQGYPYVAVSIAEPISTEEGFWKSIITIVLIMFSLSVIAAASHFLSKIYLYPIEILEKGIKHIESGKYGTLIEIDSGDEFTLISQAFNEMSNGLVEKERIQRFVPVQVLDVVKKSDREAFSPGGEKTEAVILFSDIRNFTTLSEKYSPTEIVEMLNSYFSVMEPIILKENGNIDKLIGDAINAVFLPIQGKDDPAIRACRAGLAMRKSLIQFNKQRKSEGKFTIDNGIGISLGTIVYGKVGSLNGRLDFTAVGDPVPFAARLEAESKNGKYSKVVISHKVMERVQNKFIVSILGKIDEWRDQKDVPYYEVIDTTNE